MNNGVKASVMNGNNLCYNMPFTAELVLLRESLEDARRKLMKFAADTVGENEIEHIFSGSLDIPSSREEKYRRALALVREIGRAAGRELWEKEYSGEQEPYFNCFWQGIKSNRQTPDVIGSTHEKLFYECGRASVDIVGSSVFGSNHASDSEIRDMLRRISETFAEGARTCLV